MIRRISGPHTVQWDFVCVFVCVRDSCVAETCGCMATSSPASERSYVLLPHGTSVSLSGWRRLMGFYSVKNIYILSRRTDNIRAVDVQKPRNQSWCFLVPLQVAFLCNLSRSQLCRADEHVTKCKHCWKTFLQLFGLWLNISVAFRPPLWIPSIPQIMGRCSFCRLSLTVHR